MDFSVLMETVLSWLVSFGGKLVAALAIYLVGSFVIKKLVKWLNNSRGMSKVEGTVKTFTMSFVKIGLYVILFISVITILGVEMSSVIAVLASAGVAIGLALQGALSNLAGGIMLMIFKPFHLGDYVDAAGVSGTVQDVTLFYTVFMTVDNKRITVPNGELMNANVVDYSSEPLRRVDLSFSCAKGEDHRKIEAMMLDAVKAHKLVLQEPAPFARLSGGTNEAMEFAVRVWCKNEDYWDIYFDLTQSITEAFGQNGVKAPAIRVISEK